MGTLIGKSALAISLFVFTACNPLGSSQNDTFFGACNTLNWKITGLSYWGDYLACLQSSLVQGGPTVPVISTAAFANTALQQWDSVTVGPNGKIYGIPGGPGGGTGINPANV